MFSACMQCNSIARVLSFQTLLSRATMVQTRSFLAPTSEPLMEACCEWKMPSSGAAAKDSSRAATAR